MTEVYINYSLVSNKVTCFKKVVVRLALKFPNKVTLKRWICHSTIYIVTINGYLYRKNL